MPIKKKKPLTLPAIRSNAGIEQAYSKALVSVVQQIKSDVDAELLKEFKKQAEQKKIAMDGIADWVAHVIDYLISRWGKKLEDLAPQLALQFVNRTVSNYESLFKTHLRKAGFTVRFQITDFQKESLQAVMENNVGLIKSIGSQYLDKVQGQVWKCVTDGYDLSTLAKDLSKAYDITKRRAELIARDQGAKAHAVIEKAKRQELGITKAIWLHSHAGKKPRPSHLAADGKEFDVDKGMYLDGKWIQPGELINCRCCSKSIIEGIDT
ncbi:MAG: phage head morphogenesis protein [Snodgrassella sp.]|uniref:phage head morphogenesis protein n=1 Tax=Snodgrassella sp. TaxID=2815304 RepID=UPI002587A613|nr:phage minor head protein [Snodgrassella sp.]MCO6514311.1 phage head morphogenesis protein [Snodgrassella sp.]MCO6520538.1 phage head morphogenesis protein [Snodgrassella sp.]